MSISFFDVSVSTYQQILNAVVGYMEKGREHCEANGIDLQEVVDTRLYPDMLPFHFQIVSVVHHSLNAIRALESGEFTPPSRDIHRDYEGLQDLVSETCAELSQYSAETINALQGGDIIFKLGDKSIPFIAEDFILTFSLPNFYFHATTTYDILRQKGVPLGKRDFLGRLRIKE